MKKIFTLLAIAFCLSGKAQILVNVAGDGTWNYAGDGGAATAAEFRGAGGVAVDPSGNIYFTDTDNNRVRKVNTMGIISTFAGNGYGASSSGGFSGDNGQATNAELYNPVGVIADAGGNIYITDYVNHRVRKVNTAGIITTVAGNGYGGFGGDGGLAVNASLYYPSAMAFDVQGNMYIADEANFRIRKIDLSGIITTVAGNGTAGFNGDNGLATAAEINDPMGITVGANGNIYFSDRATSRLRKISNSGIITTIAGNGALTFNGDNIPSTSAQLNQPIGLCQDAAGNIYCVNYGYNRVRKIDGFGIITTAAGNGMGGYSGQGNLATWEELLNSKAVTFDNAGRMFISDEGNMRIRMVTVSIIITAGSATMCANNPATLTVSGADTYTWSPATGLSANTGANVIASPTVTTTYTITGTKNATLYGVNAPSIGTITVTVTVNPIPTINLAGNAFSFCSGSSQTFTASGASIYTWAPAATLNNANIPNPTASPSTTTVYSVTSTGANGCTNMATVTLSVIPVPTLSVTSNSYTICAGNSATLTVCGSSTYTWMPTATLNNANLANPAASPTTITIYTVTSSNVCGVGSPLTVTVNVNANTLPTINITASNDTICAGQQTATLTASGANTYTWSTSATSATITPSPTVTTNYLVMGIGANGCTNTDTVTVIVNPLPTISVNPNYVICPASSVTICASGASTYTWSPANYIGSCMVTNAATNYTIQGMDSKGCIGKATTNGQVVSSPTVIINPVASSVCTATCAAFLSTVFPSSNGVTYMWNFGDGVPQSAGVANPCYNYITPNPYITLLTVTDVNGCVATATTSIMVNLTPTVSIGLIGYTSSMCLSICTTANPSFTPSSISVSTYTWNLDNGGPLVNVSNAYYCATHTGTSIITLTVTDVNNCLGVGTKNLIINPTPTVAISGTSTLCLGNQTTLTASGASSYTWSTSATTQTIIVSPIVTTIYTVTGTDVNSCVNTNTISIIVNNCTSGIEQVANNNNITIYPNPNNGSFVIEPNSSTKQTVQVYDVNGKLVLSQTISGKTTIDGSILLEGVYNICIISNEGVVNKRIVIVK